MYSRPSTAKPNLYQTQSTYFTQDKKHTAPFFKQTKVGLCNKVVIRNGVPIAICYPIRNRKGQALNNYKNIPGWKPEERTIYQKDYKPKPDMHAGMKAKPLIPYQPNSYRNLLPIDNSFTVCKNTSKFDIGSNKLVNRKQWVSTAQGSYRRPKSSYISNPGILSDMAKRAHYQLESIEY